MLIVKLIEGVMFVKLLVLFEKHEINVGTFAVYAYRRLSSKLQNKRKNIYCFLRKQK